MSEELKPCPFCGEHQLPDSEDDGNVPYESGMSKVCDFCSATVSHNWNTRPIEDALNKRIVELETEHIVWLNGAENIVKRLKGEIAELETLAKKLVDEGCVVAERFSARGGSESELEDWENVLDEYHDICPPPVEEW